MRPLILCVFVLFGLSACEETEKLSTATLDEMHEFMYGEPRDMPPPAPRILESRYCYKARADVLCYDTPQPGKEEQFIGAQ